MSIVAIDTETTGLNPWKGDRPFLITLCKEDGSTLVAEAPVNPYTREVGQFHDTIEASELFRLMADPKVVKIGHNLKFDLRMLQLSDISVRGEFHDTLHMAHISNSGEFTHGLKHLAKKYLSIDNTDEKDLQTAVVSARRIAKTLSWAGKSVHTDYWMPAALTKWKRQKVPKDVRMLYEQRHPNAHNICETYGRLDVVRTMELFKMYAGVIGEDPGLTSRYQMERELFPVVYDMETVGARVHLDRARAGTAVCVSVMNRHRRTLEKKFGPFGKKLSDQRIRDYVFSPEEYGGLGGVPDEDKMTAKTQKPQVTADVLRRFSDDRYVAAMLEFSRHQKAYATYFRNFTSLSVREKNYYIIHAWFNQIGPITGRFSCKSPNLQNVPKRAPVGDIMRRVRAPFGPRPGKIWYHFDYKGIEARIFAEESGDEDMIRIFAEGGDIYMELKRRVEQLTGIDLTKKYGGEKEARDVCKINFLGWTYGEGARKLARSMRLTGADADKVITALKEAFTRAIAFMSEIQERAYKDKFIRNRYGRKIALPYKKFASFDEDNPAYKAVNYIIQSTAAELVKHAMIRVHSWCKTLGRRWNAHLIMTIHDELVIEADEDMPLSCVRQIAAVVADNQGMFRRVRTDVEVEKTTSRWDEKEGVKLW